MARPAAFYHLQVAASPEPMDAWRTREAELSIMTALATKGLLEAPADQPADLLVVLAYDIGVREKYAKSSTYHLDPADDGPGMPTAAAFPPGTATAIRQRQMDNATADSTERDTQLYSEKVAVILYQKYLVVSAYDASPVAGHPTDHRIWSVEAGIEDESKALRKYVPILAAACVDYLNTNTGRVRRVDVRADGHALAVVKKGS